MCSSLFQAFLALFCAHNFYVYTLRFFEWRRSPARSYLYMRLRIHAVHITALRMLVAFVWLSLYNSHFIFLGDLRHRDVIAVNL